MSPKNNKSGIKSFRPVLSEVARDALTELAGGLGFVVSTPSLYTGKPSVPDMLEALAISYRADPSAVLAALAGLLAPDAPTAPPSE